MDLVRFQVDNARCVGCGVCGKVCPGGLISLDGGKATICAVTEFGWNGCWQCQHCLAVCPMGAIRVLGYVPEDSAPPVPPETAAPMLDSLIANRHSCRRYLDRNVERTTIDEMLTLLAAAPNGGNKQQVEFTLIDDKDRMEQFRLLAYREMERLAAQGIFPARFDERSYRQMKDWERSVRPDMLFCGAPHILIPHAPLGRGEPVRDTLIAGTYFELLCASRGLGCVIMTFPLEVLALMPEVQALLKIPEGHYMGMILGFGYPEISYTRGTQRTVDPSRIHRPMALGVGTDGNIKEETL